ncbi:hypothetical protein [Providencia phage PSTCR6]|nr:hypothetical protein [Providencia phage PSTCR6]
MKLEAGFYYYNETSFSLSDFLEKHTDFSSSEISQICQMHCKHNKAVVFKVPYSVSGKIWLEISTPEKIYISTKLFYPQSAKKYNLIKVFDLTYAANWAATYPASFPGLRLYKDEKIELVKVEFSNIESSDDSGFWGIITVKKSDKIYHRKPGYWCMLNSGQIRTGFYSVDAISKQPKVVEQGPSCSKGPEFVTISCVVPMITKFVTVTCDVPPVIKVHKSADDLVGYIAENPELGINVYDSKYNHMFFAKGA